MTRKSILQRNIKRITLYNKLKKKRDKIRNIVKNRSFILKKRFEMQKKLFSLPRNSSSTRIRNRCLLTGRSRGIYKLFSLSRIAIRNLAASCQLPGVKKSSW